MLVTILDALIIVIIFGMFISGFELRKIFINLYLPLLILLPVDFYSTVPGLPHTNPAQTAIIVLGFLYLSMYYKQWKFSYLDLLILAYAAVYCYSEFISEPAPKGEKTIAVEMTVALTEILLTYILAKAFIGLGGLHVAFTQKLVLLVFIVSLFMPYEVRMTSNLFYVLLSKVYNFDHVSASLLRYGYARFAGPFSHPILAGLVLGTSLLLANWMRRLNVWGTSHHLFHLFMFFMIFIAFIATSSRAPFIGLFAGYLIASVGYNSRHLWREFVIRIGILIASLSAIYFVIAPLFEVNLQVVSSEAEATLSYRWDLIPLYWDTVMERLWLGWGNIGWPQIAPYYSIDNQYLWLALRHGLITLGLFIAIILYITLRLFWVGINLRSTQRLAAGLIFTLLGIFFMQALVFYTVYMGAQLHPLFFILVGWSEGIVLALAGTRDDLPNYSLKYLKMSKAKRALYEQQQKA